MRTDIVSPMRALLGPLFFRTVRRLVLFGRIYRVESHFSLLDEAHGLMLVISKCVCSALISSIARLRHSARSFASMAVAALRILPLSLMYL